MTPICPASPAIPAIPDVPLLPAPRRNPALPTVALVLAIALALLATMSPATLAAQDTPPAQPAQPAQPGPDDNGDTRPDFRLVNRILFVLPRLLSPRQRERVIAARELQLMPPEANTVFLERLPDLSTRQQLEMLDILATRQAPGTPALIVRMLPGFDEAHDRRLLAALRRFGPDGWDALRLQLFGENNVVPAPDAPRQPRIERLYVEFVRDEVLELFRKRLEGGARTGYHRELFDSAFRYGALTVDLFEEIALDRGQTLSKFSPEEVAHIRPLAIRALGDSGHPRARPVLESLYQHFSRSTQDRECQETAMYALYIVGEKSFAQPIIDQHKVRAERSRGTSAVDAWAELAHIYLRVNEYRLALDAFTRSIEANGGRNINTARISNAWYNIACVHSRLVADEPTEAARDVRLSEALRAIRNAVQNGFADWQWMFRDRDLSALWSYDGFKKWIADLKADPVNRAMMPQFEPGNPPEDNPDEEGDPQADGTGDGDR